MISIQMGTLHLVLLYWTGDILCGVVLGVLEAISRNYIHTANNVHSAFVGGESVIAQLCPILWSHEL